MAQLDGSRTFVRAPAKVNLYLAVGHTRPDGYHDLETVFQTVSLADEVVIEDHSELSVATEPAIDLPADENIAHRAALLLGEAAGRTPRVSVRITKRIPHGAGLGGASADAAAVLVGLAYHWGLGAESHALLHQAAATLGSDVPFMLTGGTALCAGRGDVLVRTMPTPRLDLAIVKPAAPVPTAEAYRAFDRLRLPSPPGAAEMVAACDSGRASEVARALYNNMTEAAIGLVPEVGVAIASLRRAPGVLGVAMTGSGSAAFGIFRSREEAEHAVREARAEGMWGAAVCSQPGGVAVTEGA